MFISGSYHAVAVEIEFFSLNGRGGSIGSPGGLYT